jgi:hypothetical protein
VQFAGMVVVVCQRPVHVHNVQPESVGDSAGVEVALVRPARGRAGPRRGSSIRSRSMRPACFAISCRDCSSWLVNARSVSVCRRLRAPALSGRSRQSPAVRPRSSHGCPTARRPVAAPVR